MTELVIDELGPIPEPWGPWPNRDRWVVTRRLLAYYRWTLEGHATGGPSARESIERRAPWAHIFDVG